MKKICLFITILIIPLVFCGCAEVVYSYYSTESGERVLEWKVTLSADDIAHASADIAGMVKRLMDNEAANRASKGRNAEVIYSEDNPYVITLRESYSSLTEMHLAFGLTGDEKNEILAEERINLLFSEVKSEMSFVSQADADSYTALFGSYFEPQYTDSSAVTLQYRYGTPFNTIYGLDYHDTYTTDNTTFYVWDIDLENVAAVPIIVAQRIPRLWIWEAGAILASALVIAIAALIVVIRRKQNA